MEKQEEGKHWYSGSCAPTQFSKMETFSVGIFRWVKRASDNDKLKKSAVIYRVYGKSDNPDLVYKTAQIICSLMDAGEWVEKTKSERVY